MEPVKVILTLCVLILLVGTVSAYSPWEVEYTTMDTGVFSFGTGLGNTYAGTGSGGKIYYDDLGSGWCLAYDTAESYIRAIQEWGDYVYFGSDPSGVIFRTNGTSLDTANDTAVASIYDFEPFNSYLYAGTGNAGKILRSSDGLAWDEAEDLDDDVVFCLKDYKGYLYAGTAITGKLYKSADGETYNSFHDFEENFVYDLEIHEGYLYIAVGGGAGDANIYRTDGTTVTKVFEADAMHVYDLQEHDGALYAGTDRGYIYRSFGGSLWELDCETLAAYIYALGSSEYHVYAGAYNPGQIFSLYRNTTAEGWGYTYPPHVVKIKVVEGFGTPLVGAAITATPVETTMGSWTWLNDLFGIDSGEVNIPGSVLTGTTDNTGSVSFLMVESVQYRVNVSTLSTLIYPQESSYLLFVDSPDWFAGGENINSVVTFDVSTEEVNATHASITIIGNDTAAGFTSGHVYLNVTNTTVPGTQDMVDSYEIPAASNFSHTFTVEDYPGESYFIQFDGEHDDYGAVNRSWGVTFPVETINPLGFSDTELMWISMIILMVCGMTFTATTSWQGPLLTCFVAWILFEMGWLAGMGAVALIALPAATALSVWIIIANRRDAK